MASSIYFTESKDFKLIKEKILFQEDYFLVYVYADTSNIRIPKEMIRELPVYGNNLIWVDTANMDAATISNHMVLTIGQLLDPEEDLNFFIVSKTQKYEKMIQFLRNQGISAELIVGDSPATAPKTKTGRRGRPKKVAAVTVEAEAAPKKRGRKKAVIAEAAVEVETEQPVRKKGRPKKEKPEAHAKPEPKKRGRKPKAAKEEKPKQTRTVKSFTLEEVNEKIAALGDINPYAEDVLKELLRLPKIRRPKLLEKLVDMIKVITNEDDLQAKEMIDLFLANNLMEINAASGKINYKD